MSFAHNYLNHFNSIDQDILLPSATMTDQPNTAEAPTPYEVLSRSLPFENTDQENWWKDTAAILAGLLSVAKYPVHLQYQHLLFYYRHSLPALGPFHAPRKDPLVTLTVNGRVFEASMNFQNDRYLVRYGLDPHSNLAGTERDPYNGIATSQMLSRLELAGEKVDNTLYRHFQNELSITYKDVEILKEKNPGLPASQNMIAFDLNGAEPSLKVYWFVMLKSAATGIPGGRLMMDAIGKVNNTRDSGSFIMLEEYFIDSGLMDMGWFLSWDVVEPTSTRFKLYMLQNTVSLASITEMWTIGGRLKSPENQKGLELLNLLWACLSIPEGHRSWLDHEIPGEGDHRGSMMGQFELHPGAAEPVPKVYIPLVGDCDLEVAQNLAKFFEKIGWTKLALSFVPDLCSTL